MKREPPNGGDRLIRAAFALGCRLALLLCRLAYGLRISGSENIPTTGPCIFLGNHPSSLEVIVIFHLRQYRPDLVVYGFGGPARHFRLSRTKGIPPTRGRGRPAPALWTALKVLERGSAISIAPEGERSWDGRLQPFLPGTAWLALRSGAPIVVCVLTGGYAIWPRWAQIPRLTGRLEMRIGKPFSVPVAGNGKVTGAMIEHVNRRIAEEIRTMEVVG
jgi:1-acyl-sn-glycerol-3-phosphate acyltransferase